MRTLALARCINAAFSDNSLATGEYYLIEHHSRSSEKDTPIHQGNVLVYPLADDELTTVAFDLPSSEGFVKTNSIFNAKFNAAPIFIGARARFELIFLPGQFKRALEEATKRSSAGRKS